MDRATDCWLCRLVIDLSGGAPLQPSCARVVKVGGGGGQRLVGGDQTLTAHMEISPKITMGRERSPDWWIFFFFLSIFQVKFSSRTPTLVGRGQKCLSADWALIRPVFARISSMLGHLFHPTTPTLCHTNTALCSQSLYKTKRKKQNFCKIVMFMLYEIFIWNCFAKLLYFCMNVFFIGIIRNSYLTLACLVCLLDSSFLSLTHEFAAYLRKNYFLVYAR